MIESQKSKDKSMMEEKMMLTNLKLLSDAGVIIATGTDAGNIGTLHATSYQAELKMMQESGMTNWQILTASTLNPAKILDKQKEFGSITKGKKANIIITKPLNSFYQLPYVFTSNLIEKVMIEGEFIS